MRIWASLTWDVAWHLLNGERPNAMGRQNASVSAWILVVRPPRERPSAWVSEAAKPNLVPPRSQKPKGQPGQQTGVLTKK